jgi:hypothetical protein
MINKYDGMSLMNIMNTTKNKILDLKTLIDSVKNLNGNKIDIERLDEEIQLSIVKNSSSQLLLSYFVNNSEYNYIHYIALDKIDDEEILMDMALNNTSTYWGEYKFMTVSSYLIPHITIVKRHFQKSMTNAS